MKFQFFFCYIRCSVELFDSGWKNYFLDGKIISWKDREMKCWNRSSIRLIITIGIIFIRILLSSEIF